MSPLPPPGLRKKVEGSLQQGSRERGISQPCFHFLFAACPNKSRSCAFGTTPKKMVKLTLDAPRICDRASPFFPMMHPTTNSKYRFHRVPWTVVLDVCVCASETDDPISPPLDSTLLPDNSRAARSLESEHVRFEAAPGICTHNAPRERN